MSTSELFEISFQLRDIHATMKAFRAHRFVEDVAHIEPVVTAIAKKMGVDFFVAAIRLAKDAPNEMQTALILATAVEVKLRDNAAVCAEGRS